MSYDDSFRSRNRLSKEEVREICRIKEPAEVLELPGFGEPMADWARRAEELGQTIVPRTVYVAEIFEQHEHRVAWVYHSWRRADDFEELHHLACDCVGSMDEPDEQISEIMDCPAVMAALEHRASRVSETLKTREILTHAGKEEGEIKIKPHAIVTAKALINFVMNYDKEHPEGWIANTTSGEHQIPLLGMLMQIQPYPGYEDEEFGALTVREIVEEMEIDGSIVLDEDGHTVSLPVAA